MKTHVIEKYRSSDEANARIRELEAQIGLKAETELIDITEAWARIDLLEGFNEAYPNSLSVTLFHPTREFPKNSINAEDIVDRPFPGRCSKPIETTQKPPRRMSTRPNLFQKLENSLRRSKAELEAKQAEVDRQVNESNELQQRLRAITADVNKYRERLKRANDQYKHNRETLQMFKKAVLEGWGHPDNHGAPTYREIVALEASIADFPRVHGYIRARLSEAEYELQKIEGEQSE